MTQENLLNQFVETISTWDDIEAKAHRFGGTEFNVGKVEIGHIHHDNGMVDIPFTVKIREALVEEGLAKHHHLLRDSGWISYFIHDDATLAQALSLMQLSYLHKTGRRKGINKAAIDSLNISDKVKQVAFPRLT